MSNFEFTDGDTWGGLRVVRRVSDVRPRARLVATGLVVASRIQNVDGSSSARYTIDDGTGQVDVLFLGQPSVGGFSEGAVVTVEGAVMRDDTRNVIWNPMYRIEPSVNC